MDVAQRNPTNRIPISLTGATQQTSMSNLRRGIHSAVKNESKCGNKLLLPDALHLSPTARYARTQAVLGDTRYHI